MMGKSTPAKPERACTLRNYPPAIRRPEGRTASAAGSPTRLFLALSYVATSIARFVSLEVRTIDTLCRLGFLASFWRWAFIAVLWVETVVHVAPEIAGAMKPRASADEDLPAKPFRTVVAGGSTVIRSDVIVAIGTIRSHADGDGDLSFCFGSGSREAESGNSSQHQKCKSAHKFTS